MKSLAVTSLAFMSAALLVAAPGTAFAHPGHGDAAGLLHGFQHPLGGADHVLAMVAVGLMASLRGGRALWALPLAFVATMALGGALGMAGLGLSFGEAGIALSVVAFGALAAAGVAIPLAAVAALVGFFALFHGFAHGAEMPEGALGFAYGLGFLGATALLHGVGVCLGLLAGLATRRPLAPAMGGALALAGLALLVRAG